MAACSICGERGGGVELVVNETFAGEWHSACCHSACLTCLRRWVNGALSQCRALRQLRVQCYHPGCRKVLPQKLVLHASFAARALAEAVDQDHDCLPEVVACSSCGDLCRPLVNEACGHGACENCWERWAEAELPVCRADGRLRARCLRCRDPVPVATSLWRQILTPTEAVKGCIDAADYADAELRRLTPSPPATWTRLNQSPAEAGPVCSICREHRFALLANDCDQGHAACEACWTRWAEEHIEMCYSQRVKHIRCIGPECGKLAADALWKHACAQSPMVLDVDKQFRVRQRLQANQLFPEPMQINCPQPRCLGLGYLGYDTVMCFVCEHQWVPEEELVGEAPADEDVEVVMGIKVKRCPKCAQYIEKNGGCDHMTCRHRGCGHEFWWSTGKPYRPGAAT